MNQYINIYLHRECHQTIFIRCFIVTTTKLIWPVAFLFFLFMVTSQALIWTLHASTIQMHPLFQKLMKNLFGLISSKNTFEQGYPGGFLPYWSSEVPFSKISALFIPVNITIIFYSFLLVWITFLPWQTIIQTIKLFTVHGYFMVSHWKRKQMCSSVHLF